MRKLLLLITLLAFSINSYGQFDDDTWFASIGLNAINSQGTLSPLGKMGDWAINIPVSAALEVNWSNGLSIEQAFTINSFSEGEVIDGVVLQENYSYMSFDTHVKYYFGKHILNDTQLFDFYGNVGVGFFNIEDTNVSFNVGGGLLLWLDRRQTYGLRAQVIGKFAFNHADSGFDNNHYQTHIQFFFML